MVVMDREQIKQAVFEALRDYFNENKTVTISEAGRMLNRTRNTVKKMIQRGEIERNENGVLLQSIYKYEKN